MKEVAGGTQAQGASEALASTAEAQREKRIAAGVAQKLARLLRAYGWRVRSGGPKRRPEHEAPASLNGRNVHGGHARGNASADDGRAEARMGTQGRVGNETADPCERPDHSDRSVFVEPAIWTFRLPEPPPRVRLRFDGPF